jgi:hypothetical protein
VNKKVTVDGARRELMKAQGKVTQYLMGLQIHPMEALKLIKQTVLSGG